MIKNQYGETCENCRRTPLECAKRNESCGMTQEEIVALEKQAEAAKRKSEEGKGMKLKPCRCGGSGKLEADPLTDATFIECLSCGRCVGSPNEDEAIEMWNAAMDAWNRRVKGGKRDGKAKR